MPRAYRCPQQPFDLGRPADSRPDGRVVLHHDHVRPAKSVQDAPPTWSEIEDVDPDAQRSRLVRVRHAQWRWACGLHRFGRIGGNTLPPYDDDPQTDAAGCLAAGRTAPGRAFTVEFRLTSGEVVTVPTSLSAYLVATPSIVRVDRCREGGGC